MTDGYKVGHKSMLAPGTTRLYGTKKSLKGLLQVCYDGSIETYRALGCPPDGSPKPIIVKTECTPEEENQGLLQVIYEDGKFYNQTTLNEVRERLLNF